MMTFCTHSSRYKYCPKYCITFWNRGALFLAPCCCNLSKLYPESPVSRIYDQSFHLWLSFFKVLFEWSDFYILAWSSWNLVRAYGPDVRYAGTAASMASSISTSTPFIHLLLPPKLLSPSPQSSLLLAPQPCSRLPALLLLHDPGHQTSVQRVGPDGNAATLCFSPWNIMGYPLRGTAMKRQWIFDQKDVGMACWLSRL